MKYLIIILLLSACSSKPTYEQRSQRCFKVMVRNNIPRCNNLEALKDWDDFDYAWELGSRSGFYHGCMEALNE